MTADGYSKTPCNSGASAIPEPVAPSPHSTRLLDGRLCALTLGELAARGCAFVAMTILYRRLGAAHYGYLEAALAVSLFGAVAAELGLYVLGTREAARAPADSDELVRRIASIQLVAASVVGGAIALAAALLPLDPVLRTLLVAFAIGLAGVPFALSWLFQAQGRMSAVALSKTARYAVFLVVAVALVHGPGDARLLGVAELAGIGAMCVTCVVLHRRRGGRLRVGGPGALDGALVRSALPIGGSSLIWVVRMYLSVVLVGALAGPAAAGAFGASHRVVMVGLALLDVYFTKVFPQMSVASATSIDALRTLLRRSMVFVLATTTAAAVVMQWTAGWTLGVVYGPASQDGDTARLLALLCWLLPLIACRAHFRFALIALDLQRAEFLCSVAGAACLLVAVVPLAAAHGAVGATFAMLASELIATLLAWVVVRRALRARERDDG